MKKILHKIGIHNMKYHHDTGTNLYFECTVCGKREAYFPSKGCYQPLDMEWLNNNSYKPEMDKKVSPFIRFLLNKY